MWNEYQNSDPSDDPMSYSILSSFSHVGDDGEISDSVIKHISQVLMEDIEPNPCMFPDPLVLQSTEESLYQVIKGVDQNEYGNGNEIGDSNRSEIMSPDEVIKNDLFVQFNRGVDDGSKFLPPKVQLISDKGTKLHTVRDREARDAVVVTKKNWSAHYSDGSRGKKGCKQLTSFVEDVEDKFGKALLGKAVENKEDHVSQNGDTNGLQRQDVQVSRKAHGKKRGDKKVVIDLSGLLISCAEAVGADLRGVASELLKQIRQHSTQTGNYSQRLAHWFANALEARLAGTIGSLGFEKEFVGREILSVVACEGTERIARPETYKQWQIWNMRAGFTQLPLDYEVVNKIKDKVKTEYHKSFGVDEDGHWLLQGWKGRMMIGSACWAPNRT